jgi:hypothetical protein
MPLGNQTFGNVGLFYTCYRLSRLGWNVMPTTRNVRGIDIVAYSQDAARKITIQVKSLSKRSPVPLGTTLDRLYADFVVICRYVSREQPECFVLTSPEAKQLSHRGIKDGKVSFWLQPRQYESSQFHESWERIGSGLMTQPAPEQEVASGIRTDKLPRTVGGTSRPFRLALQCRFEEAGRHSLDFVDVNAGDLHREVGGYPGKSHHMPTCCDIMRNSMLPGDTILNEPPKGRGASFTVRFKIPRD